MSLYASQPWLSEVPRDWPRISLKFVLHRKTTRGRAGAELLSVYRDHGVVPKASRDDNFNRAGEDLGANLFIEPGDLVVNKMKAWQGSVAISNYEGIVSPAYFTFSVAKSIDGRYLHHLLRSDWFIKEYIRISSGIRPNQWDLDIYAFGRLIIPLPPHDTQRAIAAFLDRKTGAIDALVAKKEHLIELLQEKRQALITQAVTKGLDPSVPMKDSGVGWLGKIPGHWMTVPMGYFSRTYNGSTPSREEPGFWADGTVPWLTSSKVNEGRITEADQFVTDRAARECHLPIVPAGSVLIAITGEGKTRGTAALLTFRTTISQHIAAVIPTGRVTSDYLWRYLSSLYEWLRFESSGGGSTKAALTCEFLRTVPVIVPPVEEQTAICAHVDSLLDRMDVLMRTIRSQIALLREYRQALISAAVTGKIDIPVEDAA